MRDSKWIDRVKEGGLAKRQVAPKRAPARELGPAQTALVTLQQRIGNRATAEVLNGQSVGSGGLSDESAPREAGPIAGVPERVPDASIATQPSEATSIADAGVVPQPILPDASVVPEQVPNQVGLTMTPMEPAIAIRPSADIAKHHNRPDVMGWTTPNVDFDPPRVYPNEKVINVAIGLKWAMDLPQEYPQGTARHAILREHEDGHVEIGKRVAKDVFRVRMRARLGNLTPLTSEAVDAVLKEFIGTYLTEEHARSTEYDYREYPRLEEAYIGARISLVELGRRSAAIAQLTSRLTLLNAEFRGLPTLQSAQPPELCFDESPLELYAAQVINATEELDAKDLARLQYNGEFKAKVALAQSGCMQYRAVFDMDLADLGAFGRMVDKLEAMLSVFTFSAF